MPKSNLKPIDLSKELLHKFSYILIIPIILALILLTFIVVLHYAMYTWTEELEKIGCECSNLWHRNIIHWLALVIVILTVTNISITLFSLFNNKVYYNINSFTLFYALLRFIYAILFIIYIGLIYDYISKLKELQCKCSESWKREYGYISSIVYIVMYSISALLLIFGIFAGLYTYYKFNKYFK
jgi:magnesium-transporting ATPase (P-type)